MAGGHDLISTWDGEDTAARRAAACHWRPGAAAAGPVPRALTDRSDVRNMRGERGRGGAIYRGRGWGGLGGVGRRSESITCQLSKKAAFGKLAARVRSAAANSPDSRAPSRQPIAPIGAGRLGTPTRPCDAMTEV